MDLRNTVRGLSNQRASDRGALRTGFSMVALTAVSLVLLGLAACGGNGEAPEDIPTSGSDAPITDSPTATTASNTPTANSPTATPVAAVQGTSRISLDDYLLAVCGQSEVGVWEEGVSLRELSSGLGSITEQMEELEPPSEVFDWHGAQLEFQRAFKKAIDDYLEDPKGRSEDEFLASSFSTLAPHFQPVDQAIAGMEADVRTRMAEAGCIDEETSEPPLTGIEREEIPVGGSASGMLGESEGSANLQFQAEMGQKYLIEVSWEGLTRIRLLIKDPPDPSVSFIDQSNSSDSPLLRRWTAPESGIFHVEVIPLEGAGSYNISVSIDTTPDTPDGISSAWEGTTVKIRWDPAGWAEYYKVYHDDRGPGCELDNEGRPRFCDELATDVVDTNYVHASPEPRDSRRGNYYWVVACNRGGCSKIDSMNPSSP